MDPPVEPSASLDAPLKPAMLLRGLGKAAVTGNPEHLVAAVEAISGAAVERMYQRFLEDPRSEACLREREDLTGLLADREALRAMPDGSFGRAVADFLDRNGVDPPYVKRIRLEAMASHPCTDPDRLYFALRVAEVHDLLHVLTGYDTSRLGEHAIVNFFKEQAENHRGFEAIAKVGTLRGLLLRGPRWLEFVEIARERGRKARSIVPERIADLLPMPLDHVRARLNVEPPEVAHPTGLLGVGNEPPSESGVDRRPH